MGELFAWRFARELVDAEILSPRSLLASNDYKTPQIPLYEDCGHSHREEYVVTEDQTTVLVRGWSSRLFSVQRVLPITIHVSSCLSASVS